MIANFSSAGNSDTPTSFFQQPRNLWGRFNLSAQFSGQNVGIFSDSAIIFFYLS